MLRSVILLCISVMIYGCGKSEVQPPVFDGARSFAHLEKQVSFGPRVPATDAWRNCREYFVTHFRRTGFSVDSQSFTFTDPYSHAEIPLVNIVAGYRGGPSDQLPVVIMAHWDSRPRGEQSRDSLKRDLPIPGANDGASGCAVLMELATMFLEQGPECNVDFVLVDGEDWGKSGDEDYYCLGSKYFASKGIRGKYRFGIVLDMVGDTHQQFFREKVSEQFNPHLNDMVWRTAAKLNIPSFVDTVRHEIIDDHLSLNLGGVPAVDIIDFDYPYWHTDQDTPEHCSAESLANVGRVMAYILYNPSIWPKNR